MDGGAPQSEETGERREEGSFARELGAQALSYVLVGNLVMALLFEHKGKLIRHFSYMKAAGRGSNLVRRTDRSWDESELAALTNWLRAVRRAHPRIRSYASYFAARPASSDRV